MTEPVEPLPLPAAPPAGPFSRSRFHFLTGMPAGETVRVRDDEGNALFSYRSFASVIGIVAAVVASIVLLTGAAATLFLIMERSMFTAIAACVLSIFFALVIVMLVPATNVTLFDDKTALLTIAQKSRTSFPSVTYAVVTPDGRTLGLLRKSIFSRLGTNRWHIEDANRHPIGFAEEESFGRAVMRKVLGKFDRRYDADVVVRGSGEVARVIRRAEGKRPLDVLDVSGDAVDRRLLVALATLILGAEP